VAANPGALVPEIRSRLHQGRTFRAVASGWASLAVVLVLGLAAILAIATLQDQARANVASARSLEQVRADLEALQYAPLEARTTTGGSPAYAVWLMRRGERSIGTALRSLDAGSPPPEVRQLGPALRANYATLRRIERAGASATGYGPRTERLMGVSRRQLALPIALIGVASHDYATRAARTRARATAGSAVSIVVLLLAFAFFYRRSVRARATSDKLAHENERLLELSRDEALTDSLTGLRNRRALIADLAALLEDGARPVALALFDLDGFKPYNDTFGHPAGDALLGRLGERLGAVVGDAGAAYRMGGDEFCVIVSADGHEAAVARAAAALCERGDTFEIGCSLGTAVLPREAQTVAAALHLADLRMYERKTSGRPSACRQSTDVLLQLLRERRLDLHHHADGVARLAELTAAAVGLCDRDVRHTRLAAELHDVGKAAIPDAILDKPGALDDREWDFVRRHTLIGERIVRAAPALAHVADIVRSSHERFDGAGYPDGLAGGRIPLGSRVVAVCDAYDAMTSQRVYRHPVSAAEALAELRRCAGTQFDPDVVDAFCAVVERAGRADRAA
jgi:diguanylate cyclase (GGDEF)-like protein